MTSANVHLLPCTARSWTMGASQLEDGATRSCLRVMTSANTRSTRRKFLVTSALAVAIGVILPVAAAHAEAKPPAPTAAETLALARTTAAPSTTITEASVIGATAVAQPSGDTSIRPFPKIQTPQEAIEELRRRIAATRWPEKETVSDQSQGVPLATMQSLVRYWATDYDWRKAEAKLNAFPQFITNIGGLDIHFIHVRSRHKNALPLIITHGGPVRCSSKSS